MSEGCLRHGFKTRLRKEGLVSGACLSDLRLYRWHPHIVVVCESLPRRQESGPVLAASTEVPQASLLCSLPTFHLIWAVFAALVIACDSGQLFSSSTLGAFKGKKVDGDPCCLARSHLWPSIRACRRKLSRGQVGQHARDTRKPQ